MSHPMRIIAGLVLAALVLMCGCQQLTTHRPLPTPTDEYTEQQLHTDLAQFASHFFSIVTAAADQIASESDSRDVRRNTVFWKLRMIPLARQAAFNDDPHAGYISIRVLTTQMLRYLTAGDGKDIFGKQQPLAVEAAKQLENDAERIGEKFLNPEQIKRLDQLVDQYAEAHPIRGVFSPEAIQIALNNAQNSPSFLWIIDIPMTPFNAVKGVQATALAIHEFDETAQHFNDIVAQLPQVIRWQLELLLYDIEERDTITQGLAAFETIAASSTRLTEIAEKLPEQTREQAALLLEQVDGQLEGVRATLTQVDQSMQQAQTLAKTYEDLTAQAQELGSTVERIVTDLRAIQEASDSASSDEGGFDIREYQQAAPAIESAAAEISQMLAEIRALTESSEQTSRAVDAAEQGGRSLINLAAWRGLQLIAVFFVLLLIYRVIANRLDAKSS